MYDAMHAVSHGVVPEISKGSSAEGDEDYARPKGLFLRRAAVRISWLLVLVLRNTSTAPLDLMHSGDRMAVSRLVTEDDCLTSEQNPNSCAECPPLLLAGHVFVSVTKAHPRPISLTAVAYKQDDVLLNRFEVAMRRIVAAPARRRCNV